mgnify:CR=1 FL=1
MWARRSVQTVHAVHAIGFRTEGIGKHTARTKSPE